MVIKLCLACYNVLDTKKFFEKHEPDSDKNYIYAAKSTWNIVASQAYKYKDFFIFFRQKKF
jgi:hypothetical protein